MRAIEAEETYYLGKDGRPQVKLIISEVEVVIFFMKYFKIMEYPHTIN